MVQMMANAHAQARRAVVGEDVVVTRRGFVDTTQGLVLTTDAAINAARGNAEE